MKTAEQVLSEHIDILAWPTKRKLAVLKAMQAFRVQAEAPDVPEATDVYGAQEVWKAYHYEDKAPETEIKTEIPEATIENENIDVQGVIEELEKISQEIPDAERQKVLEEFMQITGDAFLQMWHMMGCKNEICAIYEHETGRYFLSFVPENKLPFYLRNRRVPDEPPTVG